MEDILIVTGRHSERAILWANYLRNRFDKITKQRGRKPFNFLHIKIDEGPITSDITQKCSTTLLQIVILCPALIALPHSFLMSQLSMILNPEKVLGILLEVTEDKVLEIHKAAFPAFRKWRRCVVRDYDQSLVGNVVGIATDILGRALCQLPPCQETNGDHAKGNGTESFTIVPRKVKIGQNKVMALLNEPLAKDDWIKIQIEKAGEIIDVTNFKKRNPYTIQFSIPESCMEISTMVEIRIEKNKKDLGSRPIKCESRLRELEQLLRTQDSPIDFMCHSLGICSKERDVLDQHLLQCFQRNMPPNFHLLAGPFEKQHTFLNTRDCSSEEYPTLLHFAAKWGFERLCIQLLECSGGDSACEIRNYAGKTPAEVAEQEGFTKLAKSLRSFTQMHEFSTMYHYFKGISDSSNNKVVIEQKMESPKSKTKKQEVTVNVEDLKAQAEYMEMSGSGSDQETSQQSKPQPLAVTNLNYINIDTKDDCNIQSSDDLSKNTDQVKLLPEPEVMTNELRINEPPYHQSTGSNRPADQFSQDCFNVLESCKSPTPSSQSDYILQPSNIPVKLSGTASADYMTQPSNRPVTIANYMNDPGMHHVGSLEDSESHLRMSFEKKRSSDSNRSRNGTLKRNGSDVSKGNADDELAEIMYDFKNNVLTIKEVEQLVEKWKNRNDVKQSFKDKQEQIERMREEYERIQEQIKSRTKRLTPFERVKKLFSRKSHSKQNVKEDADDSKSSVASIHSSQRPISSLSLQSVSSSSSSGRMSTGSACSGASLGDSGTHSDHEERRQAFNGTCRLGHPGSLMDNYLIPPPPRPVVTPASTPTPVDERDQLVFPSTHRSNTPTSLSEHYVLFPSNVPVYPHDGHSGHMDSLTYNGLNTILEAKETPNDTSVTITPIKVQKNDTIYSQSSRCKNNACSSFKPFVTNLTTVSSNGSVKEIKNKADSSITDIKKEMDDLYRNINNLDVKLENDVAKLTKSIEKKDISRQNSCESNSTKSQIDITENNNNMDNSAHEYMNI